MLNKKIFSVLLLFSICLASVAQFTAHVNLIAATPKQYYIMVGSKVLVTSLLDIGDTLKISYLSKTNVKASTVKTSSTFSATLKKYVLGTGDTTTPYRIQAANFSGMGCSHANYNSFILDVVYDGKDTFPNVLWANGNQMIADSLYNEAIKRGRENGYQPIGKITKEIWKAPGSTLSDMDWSKKPDSIFESSLPIGVEPGEREPHATRFRGYLFPPTPGNYTFWVSSDDAATLYLSTDSTPANKRVVCYNSQYTWINEWEKQASQKSVEIYLESTKKYYIELIHKDGGGGSQISLRWKWPSPLDKIEYPIPISDFSPIKN